MSHDIADAVQHARDRIGGADEDALKVEFANEESDRFEEWLYARLEKQMRDMRDSQWEDYAA